MNGTIFEKPWFTSCTSQYRSIKCSHVDIMVVQIIVGFLKCGYICRLADWSV